jgi:hypothetical protein
MRQGLARGLVFVLACLAACGDESVGSSPGTVTASIWGEAFIEERIPAAATPEAEGFQNGWEIRFTKFLVNVGALTVASSSGGASGSLAPYRVYDLHTLNGPLEIGRMTALAARRYDRVSYRIAAADAAATAANATAADVALMRAGGHAVYVEGNGTRMGVTLRFRWGFGGGVTFSNCQSSETELGLAVPSGGTAAAQVTVHGDHLFYDDLQSPDAKLRFDAIAGADRDRDGEVTLEELAAVDLTALPQGQYGTGSRADVRTLRDFVTALVTTVGHFNGEGHCDERRQ